MAIERLYQESTRRRLLETVALVALGGAAMGALGYSRSPQAAAGADSTITWRAILTSTDTIKGAGGTATIQGQPGTNETHATVHVSRAKPGSVHPWHVHKGACDKDEGIVGPPAKYTPIKIGVDGEGEVSQSLPFAVPTDGKYMVNVHESAKNLKTIVACGNLARE